MTTSQNDYIERLREFHKFERRHDLFSYMPDNWSLWRVLRHPLHRRIETLPLGIGSTPSTFKRLRIAMAATVKAFLFLLAVRPRTLLIRTNRSALKLKVGNVYKDIFFDSILRCGYSFIKIDETNTEAFSRQASRMLLPSHFDSSVISGLARLLAGLLPYRKKGADYCRQLSQNMAIELGVSIDEKWLLKRVSLTHWKAKIYEALIRIMKIRIAIVADTSDYGLILACKRQSVPFIEIQHGVFDASHPDAIPAWVNATPEQLLLPDVLACRGEYWIERLAQTHQGRPIAIPVGSELIDLARSRRQARINDGTYRIVVSSQGLDTDEMKKWLRDIIHSAPQGLRWAMSIKLHPTYDGADSPLFELDRLSNTTVIASGADTNIYDLLVNADLHLSISSACHFDAAALGIPTVVLPLEGHEMMTEAIDFSSIYLAEEPADVWAISGRTSTRPEEHFSTPNYSVNMIHLIQRLLLLPTASAHL